MLKATIGGGFEGRGWLKEYFLPVVGLSSTPCWSDATLFDLQVFQLSLELVEVIGPKLVGLRLDDLLEGVAWSSGGGKSEKSTSSICVFVGGSVTSLGEDIDVSKVNGHWSGGGLVLLLVGDTPDTHFDRCVGDI